MPEKKAPPKKPLYYYYILALAINFTDQYGYRTNVFQPAGQRDFLW